MAAVSPEEAITLEYRGRVAIITLNQEKKLNALNQDQYYRLACCMHEIAARDDVSITVLTGRGRFFSAYAAHPSPSPLFLLPTYHASSFNTNTSPAAPTYPSPAQPPKTKTPAGTG